MRAKEFAVIVVLVIAGVFLLVRNSAPGVSHPVSDEPDSTSEVTPLPSPSWTQSTPEELARLALETTADAATAAWSGPASEKSEIKAAIMNNSGVLQAYEKIYEPLVIARAHSQEAVDCGIRTPQWRDALINRATFAINSDMTFSRLEISLSPAERLAVAAREKAYSNWLYSGSPKPSICQDLPTVPYMAAYDLVAAGVGNLPALPDN